MKIKNIELSTYISSEKAFGLDDLSTGDSLEKLKSSYEEIKEIESHVRIIKDDLESEIHNRTKSIYCTDFDVIWSAIDWKNIGSTNSYWSSLLFAFESIHIFLLPGTLYEITRYIDRKRNITNSQTSMQAAFDSLFLKELSNENEFTYVNESIRNHFKKFKNTRLHSREMYVLKEIKKKLEESNYSNLPAIKKDLLYYAIERLSLGSRVDKSINNRIDAINYCLCSELNKQSNHTRYILVTDTKAIKSLDNDLNSSPHPIEDKIRLGGFVRSSRTVALEMLIRKIGGSTTRSERLCYQILEDIAQYIRVINDIVAQKHDPKRNNIDKFESNNPIVNLVSSIDILQRHVDEEKKINESLQLSFFSKSVKNDPEDFYKGLEKQIDNILKETRFKKVFKDNPINKGKVLKLSTNSSPKMLSFIEERSLKDEFSNLIAVARDYNNFSQYIYAGDIPLTQFISIYNTLVSRISENIARGIYSQSLWESNEATITVINRTTHEKIRKQVGSGANFSLSDISEKVGFYPHDISFVRFDNPIFSFSHEGEIVVINSHFKINEEFNLLFNKLMPSNFKIEQINDAASYLANNKNTLQETIDHKI